MIRSLFLLIVSLCTASSALANCCVPLSVVVSSAHTREGRPILKVTVENGGTSAISIGPSQNPWIGPGMIIVAGMRLPSGAIIANKSRAVIDPRLDSERLPAGGKVEDVVYLDEMYPEVAAEIRRGKEDIIIFWTYRFSGSDIESERLGGWTLFRASAR